jgi:hypothetical protein
VKARRVRITLMTVLALGATAIVFELRSDGKQTSPYRH